MPFRYNEFGLRESTKNPHVDFFLSLREKGYSYTEICVQAVRQFPDDRSAHLSPQAIRKIVLKYGKKE